MTPIATHPLSRRTTGTINPDGVDLVIFSAGVDLPETGHSSYEVALHEDGAPCSPECGCVAVEDRTTIWEGTAITRGEWTWHADRYVLIGVRSTGPTKPELRGRVEYLEDALADERLTHTTTSSSLASASRRINELVDEVAEYAAGAEYGAQVRDRIAAERDRAERGALVLLVLAVILAAALAWVVIA